MGSGVPAALTVESSVTPDLARVTVEATLTTGTAPKVDTITESDTISHRVLAVYVSQIEDSLLTVGGLVTGLSANFAPATVGLVVGGLVLAGVGKSLPSLLAQACHVSAGPFPKGGEPSSGWRPSGSERDYNAVLGDLLLLSLTLIAWAVYCHSPSAERWFLALIGAGFTAKALLELYEEGRLALALDRTPKGHHAGSSSSGSSASNGAASATATVQSATTEGTVLLGFGLVALVLCWVHPTGVTSVTATALALAAVGKALPSFVTASSAGSGK